MAAIPVRGRFRCSVASSPARPPDRVVRGGAGGIVEDFVAAARDLVAVGADGITTNCGFLVLHQDRLARACGAPVAASSLLQVPWVERLLPPGRRVGVITVDASSLTPRHLECAGARADTPVEGTEEGAEFTRVLLGDELELDVDRAREDVIAAARRLVERNRDVGAIVLECTNMPPYAACVSRVVGLPVYDFYSFVCWFQAGASATPFRRLTGGAPGETLHHRFDPEYLEPLTFEVLPEHVAQLDGVRIVRTLVAPHRTRIEDSGIDPGARRRSAQPEDRVHDGFDPVEPSAERRVEQCSGIPDRDPIRLAGEATTPPGVEQDAARLVRLHLVGEQLRVDVSGDAT